MIVSREGVARIDANLAAIQPVWRVEAEKVHGGALAGSQFHRFRSLFAPVEHQRNAASRGWTPIADNGHLNAHLLGIIDTARSQHIFHGEIGDRLAGNQMRNQLYPLAQSQIRKARRP